MPHAVLVVGNHRNCQREKGERECGDLRFHGFDGPVSFSVFVALFPLDDTRAMKELDRCVKKFPAIKCEVQASRISDCAVSSSSTSSHPSGGNNHLSRALKRDFQVSTPGTNLPHHSIFPTSSARRHLRGDHHPRTFVIAQRACADYMALFACGRWCVFMGCSQARS